MLSLPLAFALSQDQTLQFDFLELIRIDRSYYLLFKDRAARAVPLSGAPRSGGRHEAVWATVQRVAQRTPLYPCGSCVSRPRGAEVAARLASRCLERITVLGGPKPRSSMPATQERQGRIRTNPAIKAIL